MEYRKKPVPQSVQKLEKMLSTLPDINKSSKQLNIQQKICKLSIQNFEADIDSMVNPREPVFNRTKNYIELKSKVNQIRSLEAQKAKEKQKRIAELFAHSSKNSEYIHPDMLKNQEVKNILRKNKRSFGGTNEDTKSSLPEVKISLSTKNILDSKLANKNLRNILYNNTYRNSSFCRNNQMLKLIDSKKISSQATSPKFSEKNPNLTETDKDVDDELNERIHKSILEFGELKLKLVRHSKYKIKNF